jgi:universal stress protein E
MKLLQNILVPVDFRESSLNAFRYAIEVAALFNSKVIVLKVIQEKNLSSKTEALLRDSLEKRFDELVSPLNRSVRERITFQIEMGVIFEQIVKTAINEDINVIIAGAGSDADNETYKLSTIMEKLMRKNQVPLWIVRNNDQMPVRKILCPVDFSDASERALNNAITLASKLNAELSVLNVFTPINIQSPRMQVDNAEENTRLEKRQKEEHEEFLGRFDLKKLPVQLLFDQGDPHHLIRSTIDKGGYDLLIMGTTGRTGLSRILMGSVTEKVTRELPCSFITTKSKDITRPYYESNLGEIETYLHKARYYHDAGEIEKSIEFYSTGLKQFPDNVPMLIGLMKAYRSIGNEEKADFIRDYAKDVVTRVWGVEYIDIFGLD